MGRSPARFSWFFRAPAALACVRSATRPRVSPCRPPTFSRHSAAQQRWPGRRRVGASPGTIRLGRACAPCRSSRRSRTPRRSTRPARAPHPRTGASGGATRPGPPRAHVRRQSSSRATSRRSDRPCTSSATERSLGEDAMRPRCTSTRVLGWALVLGAAACGASESGARSDAGGAVGAMVLAGATPVPTHGSRKLDILFVIDNSATMSDKQTLLAEAVPDFLTRLVNPRCLDPSGAPTGVSWSAGTGCPSGAPEFLPVMDMHLGIVSTSLGGRGGDQCAPDQANPANVALNAHDDDQAHLIIRWGVNELPTQDAQSLFGVGNFLAWFPPSVSPVRMAVASLGPNPGSAQGGEAQMGTLVGDFTGMVQGVHDHGCGFVGSNEAFYRFLIQPDPFNTITKTGDTAQLSGIDATVLQQRADFLRPDSVVVVVVVTQKSESLADPTALGGQGWTFANSVFPNSPNLAAPEGTVECKEPVDPNNPTTTGPYGSKCTSCAFLRNDPSFASRCPDDGNGTGGYLDPADDSIRLRFLHQKQRFGVSVEYPTSRYVRGLTMATVPDSAHEHERGGTYVGDLQSNCVNPLFAMQLPTDPAANLCALRRGPRTSDMVFYAAIAGVPYQLLQQAPANPASPPKDTLSDADWLRITGADPEHYDFAGADFHMIESALPRTAENLPPGVVNASRCPPGSPDLCDPINGREVDTGNAALQYACIFRLQAPKDCAASGSLGACDCNAGSPNANSPLCLQVSGAYTSTQIASRVYPSVREMIIARALGTQGIVSSLCP